jgi:hypothetical protein
MKNLRLQDSPDGGYLVVDRNDYSIDEGIYTELYCALFSTRSATWLGGEAFNISDYKIASKTENTLSTSGFSSQNSLNLIKSAVRSDCDRLAIKNPTINVTDIILELLNSKTLQIKIFIEGNSDAYEFLVNKTFT